MTAACRTNPQVSRDDSQNYGAIGTWQRILLDCQKVHGGLAKSVVKSDVEDIHGNVPHLPLENDSEAPRCAFQTIIVACSRLCLRPRS